MPLLRRCLFGSWALGSLLASQAALAAPSARLVYVREPGAERCADQEGLRRAVAARLGYDPFFPWARVTVVAHVQREADAYRAEVTLVDEAGVSRGKRDVTSKGDDCAPLVGALALTISLALDPLSLAPGPSAIDPTPPATPAPSEPPPAPPPPAPAIEAPPVTVPPEETPRPAADAPRWRGWAGILATGTYGATPAVGVGGGLRARIEHGPWSLAVEARADAPSSSAVSAAMATGGKVQAWLAQGALIGCARVSIVLGCGMVSGGPLVASGVSLAAPRSRVLAYGAAGPRLGVAWPLGSRLLIEGFGQVAVAFQPRALQVDAVTAYRELGAALTLGAAISAQIF